MDKNIINKDELLECLVLYTKMYHRPFSAEALVAGLPKDKAMATPELFSLGSSKGMFSRVAKRAGLTSKIVRKDLENISPLVLPIILVLKDKKACILEAFSEDKKRAKIITPEIGEGNHWVNTSDLADEYLGYAFYLKYEYVSDNDKNAGVKINKNKHWFWGTLWMSKGIYRDVLLASFLINLALIGSPLFTMNVYDRVVPNNAIDTLWVLAIGIIVVNIFDAIMKIVRSYFLEMSAKKSDIIMSSLLFEKVMDLKMQAKPKSVGSFASNLKDFDSIKGFLTSTTVVGLVDLPFLIIFLFVIALLGGLIVFIPIATMVLILSYVLYVKKPLRESIEASQQAGSNKNAVLIESLVNMETIKTMGASGYAQWQWEEANGQIAEKGIKSKMLTATIPTVTNFLIQMDTVFVVVFGVYLIESKSLTQGALIAVVMLAGRALSPMGQVASLLSNFENVKQSYTQLDKIMQMPCERPEGQQFVRRNHFEGIIQFDNVSFKYPDEDKFSLSEISFKINKGEKVAIIGKIGSGKTTIEKLILGLYEATEGSILIDGIDIKQIDPVDLRKNISYVSQDIALIKGSVRENIVYANQTADDVAVIKAAKIAGVDEFVNRHPKGFDMPVGERGEGISGGQKQAIAIARAFIKDSVVYLFDEPTNVMDSATEEIIKKNLKNELDGKTTIIVTHKNSLLELVDRIIVIHDGKILLDGDKNEVIKKLSGRK